MESHSALFFYTILGRKERCIMYDNDEILLELDDDLFEVEEEEDV